jgi:hypothetical protein
MKFFGFIYSKSNRNTTTIIITLCISIIPETWNRRGVPAIYTKKQKTGNMASHFYRIQYYPLKIYKTILQNVTKR